MVFIKDLFSKPIQPYIVPFNIDLKIESAGVETLRPKFFKNLKAAISLIRLDFFQLGLEAME
jgi:hypothetical protein